MIIPSSALEGPIPIDYPRKQLRNSYRCRFHIWRKVSSFIRTAGHAALVESVFATVRHRTVRTKGALSQDTTQLMVFKLVMAAGKTWPRLRGENQLLRVVQSVTFRDGVEVADTPAQHAA